EPSFEMRKGRFGNSLNAEPAPRIGAERDVSEGESVAGDEPARRKISVDDTPLRRFGVGILLDRNHVALFDWRSHQRPEHRTIDRLQRRESPVEPAVGAGAQFWI